MGALSGSDDNFIELSSCIVDKQPAAYPVLDSSSAEHIDICSRIKYSGFAFSGSNTWSKFAKSPLTSTISDRAGPDRISKYRFGTCLERPY